MKKTGASNSRTLSLCLTALCFSLMGCGCSSTLMPEDYPASSLINRKDASGSPSGKAYGNIAWEDSIETARENMKAPAPWTGDSYGVYALNTTVNDELKDLLAKTGAVMEDDSATVRKAREQVSPDELKNFIIRQMNFNSEGGKVSIYWFEVNSPDRPSKLIDQISWSKMAMVRVRYDDPPVPFAKVLESRKNLYGEPVKRDLKDDVWGWYSKHVDPKASFLPKQEFLWRKGGLTMMLYDWKAPGAESGYAELTIRNEKAFDEFKSKLSARVGQLKAESERKDKEALEKAVRY